MGTYVGGRSWALIGGRLGLMGWVGSRRDLREQGGRELRGGFAGHRPQAGLEASCRGLVPAAAEFRVGG